MDPGTPAGRNAAQPVVPAGMARVSDVPALDSKALLQGCSEILIRHDGELYRLRQTRNNKLILTK